MAQIRIALTSYQSCVLAFRKDKEKVLKDMANLDGKFKQAAKDKSALQGEKAALEREVKRLMSQNSGLEKQMEKVKTKENKVKEERDQRLQVEKQLAALTKAHDKLQVGSLFGIITLGRACSTLSTFFPPLTQSG